jgi:hypothetical protein
MKRDGWKAPTAVHGPLGITHHPNGNANAICLENQFTSHDLCDENHEREVESRESNISSAYICSRHPRRKVRPCDIRVHRLINTLPLRSFCGFDGIPNEHLTHIPRRPLVYLTHLFDHWLRLFHFPKPWKEAKVITLPKPSKEWSIPTPKTL